MSGALIKWVECVLSIKYSTNNIGLQGQIFSLKFNLIPDLLLTQG